jgi:hypothetical protein
MKVLTARMICGSVKIEKFSNGEEARTVEFSPVFSEEKNSVNKKWSEYWPTASISIHITNRESFSAFSPGKEYDVTFTPV